MNCSKLILFVMIILSASLSWAKGTPGVSNGPHNLSVTGIDQTSGLSVDAFYRTSNEDEVCVFCHTPHGGSLTGPLWNRSNASSNWRHYNSATMSIDKTVNPPGRVPNDESMLCLSCHDGSISLYKMFNIPNDRTTPMESTSGDQAPTIVDDFFGSPANRIGGSRALPSDTGDLSDDHPISFSYDALFSGDYAVGTGSKDGQLNDVGTAEGKGVRFFQAGNNVECSSCHDPHVDYLSQPAYASYRPFLITSNSGSALCLACHVK